MIYVWIALGAMVGIEVFVAIGDIRLMKKIKDIHMRAEYTQRRFEELQKELLKEKDDMNKRNDYVLDKIKLLLEEHDGKSE